MRFLAVDPGLVTGTAQYSNDWGTPHTQEVSGGISGFVSWWQREIEENKRELTQVYIEDWMVRPNTHKLTPQPDAYLIIGFVQGRCLMLGVPIVKIGPGTHKSFNGKGKKSKVRRIGWITETTPDGHAEDGASVLLSGLLRTHRGLVTPLLKEIA